MTDETNRVFVARQPIVDARRRLFGYELLFRDSEDAGFANIPEASLATARVAIDTFLSMGIATVLGPYKGFLNVDLEMLASEAIEALPAERFVLEVLETVPPWALDRCIELKQRGFEIALDDFIPGDDRGPLLDCAEYVKVDLPQVATGALPALARELRTRDVQLLAEKVETRSEFEECAALGFAYFQGYFFAKPSTLSAEKLELCRGTLLTAFRAVSDEMPTEELGEIFKHDARLGVQLLRIANSAVLGSIQKISSLEHAVMFVGRQQLRRWILLMLYATGGDDPSQSPAIEVAAVRGRLLELLAPLVALSTGGEAGAKDGAFLAGMLSIGDAILGASLSDIVEELQVEPSIASAILDRCGVLGGLLRLAEALECGHFTDVAAILDELGLDVDQLGRAQSEAYAWYRQVGANEIVEAAS